MLYLTSWQDTGYYKYGLCYFVCLNLFTCLLGLLPFNQQQLSAHKQQTPMLFAINTSVHDIDLTTKF